MRLGEAAAYLFGLVLLLLLIAAIALYQLDPSFWLSLLN